MSDLGYLRFPGKITASMPSGVRTHIGIKLIYLLICAIFRDSPPLNALQSSLGDDLDSSLAGFVN